VDETTNDTFMRKRYGSYLCIFRRHGHEGDSQFPSEDAAHQFHREARSETDSQLGVKRKVDSQHRGNPVMTGVIEELEPPYRVVFVLR
jgi:hypothetical protein